MFVPYNGAAPAVADLLGNHIQINVTTKAVLLPHILAGRLRALAVTTAERWPELPDVPTFQESGYDGFPEYLWFGLFAPKGTPDDVIVKINAAENKRLKSSDMQEAIAKLSLEARPMKSAGVRRSDGQAGAAVGSRRATGRRAARLTPRAVTPPAGRGAGQRRGAKNTRPFASIAIAIVSRR